MRISDNGSLMPPASIRISHCVVCGKFLSITRFFIGQSTFIIFLPASSNTDIAFRLNIKFFSCIVVLSR